VSQSSKIQELFATAECGSVGHFVFLKHARHQKFRLRPIRTEIGDCSMWQQFQVFFTFFYMNSDELEQCNAKEKMHNL